MIQHATTNKVLFTKGTAAGYDTVQARSKTNPNVTYTVDMTNGRCSCPAWKFQKQGSDGRRNPCKHLKSFGFSRLVDFNSQPLKPVQSVAQKVKVLA